MSIAGIVEESGALDLNKVGSELPICVFLLAFSDLESKKFILLSRIVPFPRRYLLGKPPLTNPDLIISM